MIFEDSINLLKGNAFSNINVKLSYIFLESPAIFSEYIVPLTVLSQFDTQEAHDLFLSETEPGKNISYYLRYSLMDDYKDYFHDLKLSKDYVDSYMVRSIPEPVEFDSKFTQLEEVTNLTFDDYKLLASEIFPGWANENDYVDYFHTLAETKNEEGKVFKDFILTLNGTPVCIASLIYDDSSGLAYVHNAGTANDFRKNGYFLIINNLLINYAYELGADRIYSVTEKDSDSFNIYKKLGFKEKDIYYAFS